MRNWICLIVFCQTLGFLYGSVIQSWPYLLPQQLCGKETRALAIQTGINAGRAGLSRGDYHGAIEACNGVLRIDPVNVIALCNRGIARSSLGQHAAAMSDYNQCLLLKPDDSIVWDSRACDYMRLKDDQAALHDFEQAVSCDPKNTRAQVHLLKWMYDHRKVSGKSALVRIIKITETDPKCAYAWCYKAWQQFLADDYLNAIQDSNRSIAIEPGADAYRIRAYCRSALGNHIDAVRDLTESIRQNPTLAYQYDDRGFERHMLGDDSGALCDYDRSISLNPKDASVYIHRGRVQGDWHAAIRDYSTALKLEPNNAKALEDRGYAYVRAGNYRAAIADFDAAIRLKKNGWLYSWRGMAHNYLGERNQAKSDCSAAIELDAHKAAFYENRAIVYIDCNEVKLALDDLNNAVECDRNDERAYDMRGYVRRLTGDAKGALVDYKTALHLEPRMFCPFRHHAWDKAKPVAYMQGILDYSWVSITNPRCFWDTGVKVCGMGWSADSARQAAGE